MYCCWLKFQMIDFNIKIRTNGELSQGKNTTAHKSKFLVSEFFYTNPKAHFASFKMSTKFLVLE